MFNTKVFIRFFYKKITLGNPAIFSVRMVCKRLINKWN